MNNNILVIVVVIILILIALFTSKWSVSNGIGTTNLSFGLWENCVNNSCADIKRIYNNDFPKSILMVCRVLIITSLLVLLYYGYSVYQTQNASTANENTNLLLVGGVLSLLVSLIWYSEFRKITISGSGSIPSTTVNYNLGYSFYTNLIAGMVSILFLVYKKLI